MLSLTTSHLTSDLRRASRQPNDDALATQLLKDLAVLQQLQEADEIKALAAKMADKLK